MGTDLFSFFHKIETQPLVSIRYSMARIVSPDEPLIPGEFYVTIRTPDNQRFAIVHANMESTVYSLKVAIADWMRAYPDDIDVIALYPMADKTFLYTLHTDHRHLLVMANVPVERVPLRYLTDSNTTNTKVLNLVMASAEHIPLFKTWLQYNLFEQLDLGCDHPRIDDILVELGKAIIDPTIHSLKTIYFRRSFPRDQLPILTLDVLFVFYQVAQTRGITIILDPYIFGNNESIDFESWVMHS